MNRERLYAEEVGTVMSQMGMPPSFGKLLGWLLICDPPSQTITQLTEGLDLSKGSVSTGMRMLERSGLVRRVPAPGRGHAYEMVPEAFVNATDVGTKFTMMRTVMEKGLQLLGDETSDRADRLRITRDFYGFVSQKIPAIVEEFRETYLKG